MDAKKLRKIREICLDSGFCDPINKTLAECEKCIVAEKPDKSFRPRRSNSGPLD